MDSSDRPAAFSVAWLNAYLGARLGLGVTALSLAKFPRGTSRETWFGAYLDAHGTRQEIVLRADHPSGSTDPTPLNQEYFIYQRLGGVGLPVARALWWEDDSRVAPRPFYIREKIDGDWQVPHYADPSPAYDSLRIAVAREHIAAIAKLHEADWRGLGLGERLAVPPNAAEAARSYVATVRARIGSASAEPTPIFLEACEWLTDHAPPAARLTLCKGTNGLGEEVFRDGKLVALSDWEEVSIGDPASDFAFMQGFAEPIFSGGQQIWGMEHALAAYAELSGTEIPLASVNYYRVVRAMNLAVLARNAAVIAHTQAGQAHIRQVWTGTEVYHVCQRVLASAMGLVPPIPASLFDELNQSVDMR